MKFTVKEELVDFILAELNRKFAPVDFGEFFIKICPSLGIENFRNLLDELHQEGLITKLEQPGQYVPYLGVRTLDLRYGISIAGANYLKKK